MSLLPWPYNLLAGAAALLLVGGTAFFAGDSAGANRVIVRDAKLLAKSEAAMKKGQRAIDALNGRVAAAQTQQSEQTRIIYRDALKIVDRPVYHAVALDADGIGLLDRARTAANLGISGEPADSASGAPADPAQP